MVSPARAGAAALLAVCAVLGGFAGFPLGERIYAYQWSDARFCNDCHVHDYANEAWADSLHRDLTSCHDCHLVPIRHYPRNLFVTIFETPETAEDIPHPDVPLVVCSQCHLGHCGDHQLTGPLSPELCEAVAKVDTSVLHKAHLDSKVRKPGEQPGEAAEHGSEHAAEPAHGGGGHGAAIEEGPIACRDCHGPTGDQPHVFVPTVAHCLECHEGHAGGPGGENIPCRQCHGAKFLATSATTPDEE